MDNKIKVIPKHWEKSSWEEKARENPLYAIMTTPEMANADPESFSGIHIEKLKAKGRALFCNHVAKAIELSAFSKQDSFIVEYGCGAGRILNAVVENGYACAGIDISATMLDHCRRIVPGINSLHICNPETGKTDLADDVATVVFSYAVVQHISSLKIFQTSVFEMCRILKPSGIIALQVNCEDFLDGGLSNPGRTDNFETYSLHYQAGHTASYKKHNQNNWSGVYIGSEKLRDYLSKNLVEVVNLYYHNPQKLRAIWVIGRKRAA